MKPPYSINSKMLTLCSDIMRLLGQFEGLYISKPEPKLRKSNRVRTIHASLGIEGNTLKIDQVTAIFDGKKILGSQKEILEVQNAIKAYSQVTSFKPYSTKSLRLAHGILMNGLITDSGLWRTHNVEIFHGKKIAHIAPQAKLVQDNMDKLFTFAKTEKETHPLILSAILHYEIEFIHPFSDGNGRVGRLWQTVLLSKFNPIFEFTPVESVVKDRQANYYKSLGLSDKAGHANEFIEFSLSTIFEALENLKSEIRPLRLASTDRLEIAKVVFAKRFFSRKDYLEIFKTLSTATASRDLASGVHTKILIIIGEKALAKYRFR